MKATKQNGSGVPSNQQLAAAYAAGKTHREIGEEFGISGTVVGVRLRKLGVKARPAKIRPGHFGAQVYDEQLVKAHRHGKNAVEISAEFHINRHSVRTLTI
jgi:DNA-binding CsgD family transcriptional regulator